MLNASPNPKTKSSVRVLLFLFKVSVTLALLYFVLSRINVADAANRLVQVDLRFLIVASLMAVVVPFVLALRWWLLARPLVTGRDAVSYTWIGLFYGLVLPGGISGDVAKGSLLALNNTSTRQARLPASILTDRLVGFEVMLLFFCGSCLLLATSPQTPEHLSRFSWIGAGLGFLSFGLLLSAWLPLTRRIAMLSTRYLPWPSIRLNLQTFIETTFTYSQHPKLLLQAAAISALSHTLSVAMLILILHALNIHMDLFSVFALYSAFAVLGMLPVSIAGIGVRDWFAVHFFSFHNQNAEAAIAFTWLCLSMSLLQAAIGGFWQLRLFLTKTSIPSHPIE